MRVVKALATSDRFVVLRLSAAFCKQAGPDAYRSWLVPN